MKRNRLLQTTHYTLLTIVFVSVLFLPSFVFGEENLTEICQEIIDKGQQNLSKENYQELLKECQAFYEEEIKEIEEDLSKTGTEKKTLENKIYSLKGKITNLNYQINQSNLIIKDLGIQIGDTELSIEKTSLNIEDSKEKLSNILRTIYEEDQKPIIEILLSEDELSDFFDNLVALELLNSKGKELLQNIKLLKTNLEEQKISLDEEKDDLGRTVKVQTLQKQQNEEVRKEQEQILKMTETQYQQYLKEKQDAEKKAQEIRRRIFELAQVPDVEAPTFEEAYILASWAGGITGVRSSLILGLLEAESAIGKNVGQCNCAGRLSCRYPNLTYKNVMSSRQWVSFQTITQELGLDPDSTPISCYVDGGNVQWGGAMGPAQFMPNTWLNAGYKQRVENITGVRPANPWRVKDAFLAAALYLTDWKANTQQLQNEIGAVTAYLCGTSIMTARCRQAGGEWYRNFVIQKADQWQKWINEGVFN